MGGKSFWFKDLNKSSLESSSSSSSSSSFLDVSNKELSKSFGSYKWKECFGNNSALQKREKKNEKMTIQHFFSLLVYKYKICFPGAAPM